MLAPADRHRDQPTLDERIVSQLRTVMEDDFADLFVTYLDNVSRELARLTGAMARGDAAQATSAAHTIKGSSANLGAQRLAHLCRDLEARCRVNTLDTEADQLRLAIHEEFATLRPIIERHCDLA